MLEQSLAQARRVAGCIAEREGKSHLDYDRSIYKLEFTAVSNSSRLPYGA
jgi:hypothetical protein